MGSKGSQTTTQQQQQTYQPAPQIGAAGTQAINMATTAAGAPFQMPVAPIAPFNPFQQYGFGETFDAQGMAQPYFGIGSQYLAGSAAPISGQDVANYYNPMAANVFANLQDIFGQQMRETTGQATQTAGGVGADRIGVAQANLAKQQGLAAGQTASQLYQQALQAAEQQKQMMAGAGYGFGQMGPAAQAAQLQGIGALLGVGGQQQQLTQAQLNALYQNQLAQIAYPFQTAQYLAGITGGLAPAMGGTTTGTATTTQPGPTLAAQLLGIGTAGLGLYGGMGGSFSNPFASATPTGPTDMSFNTAGLGGGGTYYYSNRGGAVPFADGGDVYGKLAEKGYRKELGDMVPAAEAGNPIADIMMQDIGGSLPMQAGGTPNPFTPPRIFQHGPNIPQWAQSAGQWMQQQPAMQQMMRHRDPSQLMQQYPQFMQQLRQQYPQIGQMMPQPPHQFAGGMNIPFSSGMKGSQAGFQSGGSGGDLTPVFADGGNADQPPPVPGASIPQVGGATPIPFISLPTGSGEFHNRLQFSSPSAGSGSGSGLGDVAKIASAAAQMLPMLMAARGGGVSPFDAGKPFQDGGDTSTFDVVAPVNQDSPFNVRNLFKPAPTPAPPPASFSDRFVSIAQAPAATTSPLPVIDADKVGLDKPVDWGAPAPTTPEATEVVDLSAAKRALPPPTLGQYMLPQSQLPYPDATQRDVGQNLARSPWMALVEAGARMAQTRGPIGSVIGAGIEAGAGELKGQRKALQSEEDINLKAQHLAQMAQIHLDEYTRMKPYEEARLAQENYVPTYATTSKGHPIVLERKSGTMLDGITRQPVDPDEQLQARGTGAAGGVSRWRHDAWLAAHPGDEEGALNYASGHRQMSDAEIAKSAITMAQRDAQHDTDASVNYKAYVDDRRIQYEQQLRRLQQSGAVKTPTQADIDYVRAHPEVAARFKERFGIEPP